MRKYAISQKILYVRDEDSVSFHVESGDYFGTIATIISLVSQDIERKGSYDALSLLKALKSLEKDLIHLQANYDITPKKLKHAKNKKQK